MGGSESIFSAKLALNDLRIKRWSSLTFVSEEEEECVSIGYAKSVREVKSFVGIIVATKDHLDGGWWNSCRAHHPNVTLKISCLQLCCEI